LERNLQREFVLDSRAGWWATTETVKRAMKIFILMAIFSAIAAASYRRDQSQQPTPVT
jgi:hypothetical protein